MTIEEIIEERGIEEVLHFTTNHGLVGICSLNKLVSRDQLPKEKALEHIIKYNSKFRSDSQWTSYVNLSISRINTSFFGYSQTWHREEYDFWVIFAFDAQILAHDGVVFTTTNNIYRNECKRDIGQIGLNMLFHDQVVSKRGRLKPRDPTLPLNWTTCEEAEVLYPNDISLEYLKKLYVPDEATFALASAALSFDDKLQHIEIEVNTEKFMGL
ncbi:DarT ssDNA thymidine ADP-ribosyltransferase family protein [Vibrio diazotrophicus]|uniref:DarT ssDNA thymidine ADP-ribosyltransferase family protein n=1 Tax=Vibrio diazotrophicus TaxID=685 RepID=UPI0005A8226D|nr:DarT ssDNA thymidine ADP-ribosyltransferase family protein [Vibrio diazotrophicus]